MASEEENLGLGLVPCKPQVVGADSQSFDQNQPPTAVTDVDAAKSTIPGTDASQLVGAPAVLAKAVAVDSSGAKKKRGRPPRGQPKPPPAKKNREDEEEEDVCFICFDGGSLVLCDRRGCPKAYHPACIKRDEAFFRSKAKWNCGWHICSICQKAAHHMCYTCTYSLCKGCIRKADYVSVRGDRGFCTICMRTIMLIENSAQGTEAQVDFDDKTSWEYLFKVYWVYLKGKLSLTLDELTQARNPWKEAGIVTGEDPLPRVHNVSSDIKSISNLKSITAGNVAYQGQLLGVDDAVVDLKNTSNHKNITSIISVGNLEESESKRRKTDELLKLVHKEADRLEKSVSEGASLLLGCKEWATKELLEFVAHMKNGDTSALSQFDVQALMLEYIKRHNLRDPRRKSQIICDFRLKNLFGKQRVGHFEMLKLLEFHFLIKDNSQKNIVNMVTIQGEADWNSDSMHMMGKDKKRKTRRKVEEQFPPNNLDEFAAIDVHNMNLIYLRRNLMETLTDDKGKFHAKVVGSIVRIRISGNDQKQETHRLTQVVGTSKVEEPYKIGNRSIDFKLEVLNLNKKETVPIDAISNQELSEDECRRLRQSIRCGLAKRFTVGEIQEKAIALQSVRLNDWLETEIMRLNHLRDRASEKGHKKELRECVEKLQLLKTPEERQRRLSEIPLVHSDPKMNPEYVSEEDAREHHNKKHGQYMKQNYSAISSKGRKSNSSPKRAESSEDAGSRHFSSSEQTRIVSVTSSIGIGKDALRPNSMGRQQSENGSVLTDRNHQAAVSSSFSTIAPEAAAASLCARSTPSADSEADKLWHYRDPNGKVQGPFSMVQLQKWNMTGYFPLDMRIWMSREDDSLLLTDALRGEFHNHDVRSSGNMTATERVGNPVVGPLLSSTLSGTSHASSLHHQRGDEAERVNLGSNCWNIEDNSNSHVFSGQSSGQNWGALPEDPYAHSNLNSDLSVDSLTKSTDLTKHSGRMVDVPNLDSPTPNGSKLESEDQDTGKKQPASSMVILQDLGLLDLPSPTPNTRSEEEKVPDTGNKEYVPSKLLVQDTGSSWSGASSLGGGGVQLPEAANEWPRYSSTQIKASVEEWDSGLVSASLKPLEATGDHRVVTSTPNIGPIIHALPSQPMINMSWPAGVHEPIEFSTLAEESVSDLLAEVDALESQNGLPSPTSKRINISEDFIHGSIEEFSPTPDQGTRSDGFSSTDVQLPCQSATPDELVGASHANVFDFLSRSSGLQSTLNTDIDGVEAKSIEAVKHMDTVEIGIVAQKTSSENMVRSWAEMNREEIKKSNEIQPPALLTRKQDMIDVNNAGRASDGPLIQPSAGADADRETKANEILLKQDESINAPAPPVIHTDVVDLNIAGVAGPEGMDYIWENGKEERVAHQAEIETATKSSANPVAGKEDGEFQPSASLTMSLGLFEPKIGQKAGVMEVINPVWNSSSSTTTFDQNNAGEGMTHQSSVTAGVGTEDDGEYIRPLTLSLDLGDPHIGRRSASSSDLAQGNTNPGRSSGQGLISNAGWGNKANVNANHSSGFGSDTQRRYGGEIFNSPSDGGERFNSPRERERAYQGEDLGFSRGRTSWSRQSSFGGSGSGSGGGHSRPSPKGQRICKFYESGRCKKGASCNYLHP